MNRTRNTIHSYGRELEYQTQRSDANTYMEPDHGGENFAGELEDTSGKTDLKATKSKKTWGMSGLREKAKAKIMPGKPKGTTSVAELPESLRIVNPSPAVELPADDIAVRRSHSPNPFDLPEAISPGDSQVPAYIYDRDTNGLIKNPNIKNPNHRNFDSLGSTTAQADTSIQSESEDPVKDLPRVKIPRRATNPAAAHTTETSVSRGKESGDAERLLELSKITNSLLRASLRYPELKGSEDESTEDAITRFISQYGQVSASMRDHQGRLDPAGPSRKELIKAQDELRAARTKLQDQGDVIKGYEHDIDSMNRTIASLKFQIRELESSHGVKLRNENERLKSFYETQLRKSRDEAAYERGEAHRRQKEDKKMINELEARLLKDVTLWDQAYNKLKASNAGLEQRLNDAKADEDERMYELEDKWDHKLQKERAQHEDSVRSLEKVIEKLENALAKERTLKEAEKQDLKNELEEKYKEEKEGLRAEVEVFKVAVTQREHFKGLTDSEVANHYKRLANSIEDFARIDWDVTKEENWPISQKSMQQLGRNTRKLRHQIIQNTLWVFLYNHIFCSPFKILGPAGEEYDEGWIQIYSEGASSFEWPDISAEVERSRFESAKAYLDAVGSSANSSGLKESFERSVTAVVRSICRALENVATVQAKDRKSLETIIRLAAKIWLETCSQRYRLIVVLSHGGGDILSSADSFEGTLKLIVRPDLKRYGDSQGKHLTRGEPVAGWTGLLETYPQ